MKFMPQSSFIRSAFLGLILAPIAQIAGPAHAQVIIHKSTSYFTIKGDTAEALDGELARLGPKTESLNRHPGAAQIKFSGDLTYRENTHGCSISKARVNLTVKIILPRWADRRRHANTSLSLLWDTLAGDIRRHEERHAEIAATHARKLEKTLVSLPAQRDCHAMEAAAEKATDLGIAEHDKDQQRFDRIEAINFEARMMRLLRYHSQQASRN